MFVILARDVEDLMRPAAAKPVWASWEPTRPVLQALRVRRAAASKPGGRADGLQAGLAVQGGGMRGVGSASKPYLARSRFEPDPDLPVVDPAPPPGTPEVKRDEVNYRKLVEGVRTGYRVAHPLEGTDAVIAS